MNGTSHSDVFTEMYLSESFFFLNQILIEMKSICHVSMYQMTIINGLQAESEQTRSVIKT